MTHTTEQVLQDIADALDLYIEQDLRPSLMSGRSGIALFYAYYYRLTGNEKYLETLGVQVTQCIEDLLEQYPGYNHCNGLAGIAWTLQHLVNIGIADAEDFNELLDSCDNVLATYMDVELAENGYDFLHEGLGAVLYFIERMPHEKALHQLQKTVVYLEKAARLHESGTRWQDIFTTKEKGYEHKELYNLGLAHGTPAILTILGLLYERGIMPVITERLITGGIQWLTATRYATENESRALYPTTVDSDNKPVNSNGSRLGWCYGDLGIAHTLLHAGMKLGNDAYKAEACDVFEHILRHRNKENGSIADACFCHGSAGIAQMYRRAYISSGRGSLLEGAKRWTEETLRMNHWADGAAGFKYHTHSGDENSFHLLDGIAGIGLSLIAALDEETDPAWDRCFLLS
jgi:lantibiotic modifying enzyme